MSSTSKRTPSKRILEVLEAILNEPNAATALYLSKSLNIPLATVYRQLESLNEEGFITSNPTGTYGPGHRFRSLVLNSISYEPDVSARRIILKKLADELDETVSLSIPMGEDLVYYDRFESYWPIQKANIQLGDKLPLTSSASGKLYLSSMDRKLALEIFKSIKIDRKTKNTITTQRQFSEELDKISHRGFAFDNEEWIEGMIGASVPIYNKNGDLCSCLSTHSLTLRKSLSDLENKIPAMQNTAEKFQKFFFSQNQDHENL